MRIRQSLSVPTLTLFVILLMEPSLLADDIFLYSNHLTPSIHIDHHAQIHMVTAGIHSGQSYLYYTRFDSNLRVTSTTRIPQSEAAGEPRFLAVGTAMLLSWRLPGLTNVDRIFGRVYSTTFDSSGPMLTLNDEFIDANRWNDGLFRINDTLFQAVWHGNGYWSGNPGMAIYGRRFSLHSSRDDTVFVFSDVPVSGISDVTTISFPEDSIFVYVWLDDRSGALQPYYRRIKWSGLGVASSVALLPSDSRLENFFYFDAMRTSDTTLTVVFSAESPRTGWGIYAREIRRDGRAMGSLIQLTPSAAPVTPYSGIALSQSCDGRLVVAWEQESNRYSRIYERLWDPEWGSLTAPFPVSSRPDTIPQYTPQIKINRDRVYTFWEEPNQEYGDLWGTVYSLNDPPTTIRREPHSTLPAHTRLLPNYPNPFNNRTMISYQISLTATPVKIEIISLSGEYITTLSDGVRDSGEYQTLWNGKNEAGQEVATGIYFVRLTAPNEHLTQKLLFIK